jgi:hypothetical protein
VRQRENHAAAGRQVTERHLFLVTSHPHLRHDLVRRYGGQAEDLEPVTEVRTHAGLGQLTELLSRRVLADHAAQVRLEPLHALAPAPPQQIGNPHEEPVHP